MGDRGRRAGWLVLVSSRRLECLFLSPSGRGSKHCCLRAGMEDAVQETAQELAQKWYESCS